MVVTRFTARFDSECSECMADIYEGDEAAYVEDEVCCGVCAAAAEEDEEDQVEEFKTWHRTQSTTPRKPSAS